jgi:adenylate cyclase, class 2
MPDEIEAKIKIEDPESFRRRMTEQGPPSTGPVLEVNRLFDDAAGSLLASGSALRLREEQPVEGGPVERVLLTYKGPRQDSPMKRRPELETGVGSAETVAAIFKALGLAEAFRYEKRRTAWMVDDCEVVLDELPHLGWFVEVEGPTEEAVFRCLAEIGLTNRPIIKESYIGLLQQYLAAKGADPTRAVFGNSI